MKKKLTADDVELEEGPVIKVAKKKTLPLLGLGAVCVVSGLVLCILACVACAGGFGFIQDKNIKSPFMWFGLAAGVAVVGLALLTLGAFGGYRGIVLLVRKERFVLGENALQWLQGENVQMHLPYDNIDQIGVETTGEGEGAVDHLVIDVIDVKRGDTIMDNDERKRVRKRFNHDVAIEDFYEITIKAFHRKLLKKWQAGKQD
jgi:hypothetical protein